MPTLYLASTSPARRVLMDGLHVAYVAEAPGVNEVVGPGKNIQDAVRELAHRKAAAVQSRHPDAWVLGADQLVSLGGLALGKPENRAAARKQLKMLMGNTHEVVTGVSLLGPGVERSHVEATRLTLLRLPDDELDRYLELGEWQGCAGGYRVEGAGQALMSGIEGDRTNVQGLPMHVVVKLLREVGFRFFEPRATAPGA